MIRKTAREKTNGHRSHLAVLLVFAVAMATLCFTLPAQAASDNSLSEYPIMNLTEPENFSASQNPLGTDEDTPVLLVEEAELLRFMSHDNNSSAGESSLTLYDTLAAQTGSVEGSASSAVTTDLKSSQAGVYGLCNVQAVSFDPAGTGRRDHVAFVGLDESSNVKIVVYNTTNGAWSSKLDLGSLSRFVNNNTNYYALDGALSITAGDYDNDRKDTLVVYAAVNDSTCAYVIEVSVRSSGLSITLSERYRTNTFINPDYRSLDLKSSTDSSGRDYLRGEVKTGDFNSDGIDDLAVLTQAGKLKGYEDATIWGAVFGPYLCTACGSANDKSILTQSPFSSGFYIEQSTASDGSVSYGTMYGASMAVGDIDGSGCDTIVVVGRGLTIKDKKGNGYSDNWSFQDSYAFGKVVVSSSGSHIMNFVSGDSSEISLNSLSKKAVATDSSDSASIGVATVCFDGVGTPAYLVIDGCVYSWQSGDAPEEIKNFADSSYWGGYGSRSFVNSVAVGNFTTGDEGYEQLIFTIAEKISSTEDNYRFRTVMIYGSSYGESGTATDFACTTKPETFINNCGDNREEGVNGLVVAVDSDDDGTMVKYDSKEYYYSDPAVLAVLQAAPYFQELYRNDAANLQNGGRTILTLSESHGTAYGESQSFEYEAGFNIKLGGGIYPVEANIKAGYQGSWTSGWEESMSYQVSETFMATTTDQVIVYRTPVFCYNYLVYNQETEEYDGYATYYLNQQPTYIQMDIDDYERFAADYNIAAQNKVEEWKATHSGQEIEYAPLNSLSDLAMIGNEGDPWSYQKGGTTYGTMRSLSTAGGESGTQFEITSEYTEYTEESNGGYVGFDIMTNSKFSPINGGIEGKFAFDWSSSAKQVSGKSVVFEGNVGNLVKSTFISEGYDALTYDAYGFDWQFCMYDTYIPGQTIAVGSECFNTVQVLGYRVSNLRAAPSKPEILSTEYQSDIDGDHIDFSWQCGTRGGASRITGYEVYQLSGSSLELIEEFGAGKTDYQFFDLKSGTQEYSFQVQAKDSNGNLSMRSDTAYAYTTGGTSLLKATYKGIVKQNSEVRYEYEVRFNNGNTVPFYLISNGTSGGVKQDRETYDQLKREQLMPAEISDWSSWVEAIDAICKLNGHLDSGEMSYTWTLDQCSEIRSTTCAICGVSIVERHELHAHDYVETVVPGTCATQGYTKYECKNCGLEVHDNWTDYVHDYQEVEVSATCASEGATILVCATCGDIQVVETHDTGLDPNNHVMIEQTVMVPVDSDNDGVFDSHALQECRTCEYCGKIEYGNIVGSSDHCLTFTWIKSGGTPAEEYFTCMYLCNKCNYKEEEPQGGGDRRYMLNRDSFFYDMENDCGYTDALNNITFQGTKIEVEDVDEGDIVAKVTCYGYMMYMGERCSERQSSVTISICKDSGPYTYYLDLDEEDTRIYYYGNQSCQNYYAGYLLYFSMCDASSDYHDHLYFDTLFDSDSQADSGTCLICGQYVQSQITHAHDCETYNVAIPLAGGTGGYAIDVCTECGCSHTSSAQFDQSRAVGDCPHVFVELEHSCSDTDHVRRVCTVCGYSELVEKPLVDGEVVAHNFETVTVEPTCTEPGYSMKKCIRCGKEVDVTTIQALSHTALAGADVVVKPTCQHEGYTLHTCATCGEKYEDSYTEKIAHDYKTTTVAATCSSGVITKQRCSCCGDTYVVSVGDVLDKDAHEYDMEVHPLTCTSKGYFRYTCRHCGEYHSVYFEDDPSSGVTKVQNTPVGHVEDTSVSPTVVAPTETEAGYTLRHCAVCAEDYKTDPVEPTGAHEGMFYSGMGAPKSTFGQNGDIYLDIKTSTFYIKKNNAWSALDEEQEDPDTYIMITEGYSVNAEFGDKVPQADRELIRSQLGKVSITDADASQRVNGQLMLLEECFPDLWEQVSMESFLKDPINEVHMSIEIGVHVEASDLFNEELPYIEYSFDPEAIVVISSPEYGEYVARFRLTPAEFEKAGAQVTVTVPVCGKFEVSSIKHINSETGELYNEFTADGYVRFDYDKEENVVRLTVGHFSSLLILGKSQSDDDAGDADQKHDDGRIVPNTGDNTRQVLAIAVVLTSLAVLMIVGVAVRTRRSRN